MGTLSAAPKVVAHHHLEAPKQFSPLREGAARSATSEAGRQRAKEGHSPLV